MKIIWPEILTLEKALEFHVIMGKNAVNISQNYFHNEDLSEAKILIMKIIWTDIHGHYSHNVVKIFLVCTRFHNELSDITTTQADRIGTSERSSQLTRV